MEMKIVMAILSLVLLQLCTTVGDASRGMPGRGSTRKPDCFQLACAGDFGRGHIARSGPACRGPRSISSTIMSLRGGSKVGEKDGTEERADLRASRVGDGMGEDVDMETDTHAREVEEEKGGTERGARKPPARACDVWEIITGPGKPEYFEDYNFTVLRNSATGAAVEFVHVEDQRPVVGFFRFLSADILGVTPDYEIDKDMWRDCAGYACFVNGHHTGDFLQAGARPD
jgi:hypothetical protein